MVDDLRASFIPEGADSDSRYRLGAFAGWLGQTGRHWTQPDLAAYRDAMLDGELGTSYALATVAGHLATIRSQAEERRDCSNAERSRRHAHGERWARESRERFAPGT